MPHIALTPLLSPLEALGIPSRLLKLYARLCGGPLVRDMLFHLPFQGEERLKCESIKGAPLNETIILRVHIKMHMGKQRARTPYRILCMDANEIPIDIVFFNGTPGYFKKILPEGGTRFVIGKLEHFGGTYQMSHPAVNYRADNIPLFEPQYALSAGVTDVMLKKNIAHILSILPQLPEWIDDDFITKMGWPSWRQAFLNLHKSTCLNDLDLRAPSRMRLCYDEFLHHHLVLAILRGRAKKRTAPRIHSENLLFEKCLTLLPYTLTKGQQKVIDEIKVDMAKGVPMARLLQGDVGAGKTIVAFCAALHCLEQGYQSALMAPTTVLANQHFETLKPLADNLGITIALLTGETKAAARRKILKELENGDLQLIIGTHALFQETVQYKNLGFVVIDEQHRYGVHQRLNLKNKGDNPHLLVMTATPIPRTLLLGLYGDLDVSKLTEKPQGRLDIKTTALMNNRIDELVARLQSQIEEGAKVYWICPLIEESEKMDLIAAENRFAFLQKHFGMKVGLVHGRMKEKERDETMLQFKKGDLKILVATTVIEVGVDVKDATIMVIEETERFGLSQLHQLRGRVGRSDKQSYCILLHKPYSTDISKARIDIMRQTNDGFLIAEEDLKLRGAGDVLGSRQSGFANFRLGDVSVHKDLFELAYDHAQKILEEDPALIKNQNIRLLFDLFKGPFDKSVLESG